MKLTAYALETHLKKGILPLYWVCGTDPAQREEINQQIFNHFQKKMPGLRLVHYTITQDFDWESWHMQRASLPLFDDPVCTLFSLEEENCLEIVKKQLSRDIEKFGSNQSPVIINSSKLSLALQRSAWFQSLESHCAYIPLYPLTGKYFQQWLMQKARQHQLTVQAEALEALANLTEGNQQAAYQCFEKLSLTIKARSVTVDDIWLSLMDNSQVDVYRWTEQLLRGNQPTSLRLLLRLRSTGTEPVLVLWAISKMLRDIVTLQHAVQKGDSLSATCQKIRIWERQVPLYQTALSRYSAHTYLSVLSHCATIDQQLKQSYDIEGFWRSLEKLTLSLTRHN